VIFPSLGDAYSTGQLNAGNDDQWSSLERFGLKVKRYCFFFFGLKKVGAQFWYGAKWSPNSSEKVIAQDYCVYIDELEPSNCFVEC
jgi:hypothetical protein